MARFVEIALNKALTAPKACNSFTNCRCIELRNFFHSARNFKSAASATKCSLDSNGKSMFLCKGGNFFMASNRIFRACNKWCTRLSCNATSRDFISECANCFRWGTDPDQSSVENCLSKMCILGKKSISRVHSISTRLFCKSNNFRDVEVSIFSNCALE